MAGEFSLEYLEKKEKKVLFTIKSVMFSHGHATLIYRVLKGAVLGFGLGNILLSGTHPPMFLPVYFMISLVLSVIFIHHERRHYNRKGFKKSVDRYLRIFGVCLLLSLLVLFYSDFTGFAIVLSTTIIFASLSYGFE